MTQVRDVSPDSGGGGRGDHARQRGDERVIGASPKRPTQWIVDDGFHTAILALLDSEDHCVGRFGLRQYPFITTLARVITSPTSPLSGLTSRPASSTTRMSTPIIVAGLACTRSFWSSGQWSI